MPGMGMDKMPSAEELPSKSLERLGFTKSRYLPEEEEDVPKTFEAVIHKSVITITAYDENCHSWTCVVTNEEALDAMGVELRKLGFTDAPHFLGPQPGDTVN